MQPLPADRQRRLVELHQAGAVAELEQAEKLGLVDEIPESWLSVATMLS